ncbi:hypothetical protein TNIN_306871 [Trichonephila inaurata madagascariensis]|uniref:Uncharacterized protein n=1 Tax=Trichonephila inaurata madagascariensis TaxID=2747483 RepID=A0A8X6X076_9ARAC|nr:hypothetical protein TNIN_306871 [Trichonephila inaurata madagascariensis]
MVEGPKQKYVCNLLIRSNSLMGQMYSSILWEITKQEIFPEKRCTRALLTKLQTSCVDPYPLDLRPSGVQISEPVFISPEHETTVQISQPEPVSIKDVETLEATISEDSAFELVLLCLELKSF